MNDILVSFDVEDTVIATLLHIDEERPVLIPLLNKDSFYQSRTKDCFEAIKTLYENDREIDFISVGQWLRDNKGWEDSDVSNLPGLGDATYSDPEAKVLDLNDKRNKRNLNKGLRRVQQELITKPLPATEFLTVLEKIIHDQVDDLKIPGLTYSEVLAIEENKSNNQKLNIADNFMTHTFFGETGFHKGEILVPFADTGTGKTYWVVWLCSMLLMAGYKGVFVIRESRAKKLFDRFEKHVSDVSLLDNMIVADIEQGIRNLDDAVQTIKYHNAVSDIDFFVIDHIKILPVDGLKEWEETQRIQTVINRMIYLSQEVNALGIAISQVNRETLKHASGWKREPDLHNIYGSSAIEQAAHMAVSIFRPSNYEDLCIYDNSGNLEFVKGPDYDSGDILDKHEPNSLFIRQKKVREGELYRKIVKFNHTDNGLIRTGNNDIDKSSPDLPF